VLLRSSERKLAILAINYNAYKTNISGLKRDGSGLEMNFARRGRGTKRRKRNFPNKGKGVFSSAGSVICSQTAG
jgi:hypothetical protein